MKFLGYNVKQNQTIKNTDTIQSQLWANKSENNTSFYLPVFSNFSLGLCVYVWIL